MKQIFILLGLYFTAVIFPNVTVREYEIYLY